MSFLEEDISEIVYLNETFLDSEKTHNQYLLGSCNNDLIFECGIDPNVFFKSSYNAISTYLFYHNLSYDINSKIEIIQIVIINDCMFASLKTYWIKLIQRHWKKTFKIKKQIITKRKNLEQQFYFQINGKYKPECNILPKLCGMLNIYKNSNKQ
jgi:hypothetical protein